MAGIHSLADLEAVEDALRSHLNLWGLSPDTVLSLVNVSENATFRADDPHDAAPLMVRVHRPGYHTRAEIQSELAWIDALRAEEIVPIPAPRDLAHGGRIASIPVAGAHRHVVAFDFMTGTEPRPSDDLVDGFQTLGAISARLHAHACAWTPPSGFTRKTWTFATTIGKSAYWGDWRAAPGLTQDGLGVLERACRHLEKRLAAFGTGPEQFGLIHADLRLANLLIDGRRIGVIDFDDCGFGWFAFDFAAAISFFETAPSVPELQDAWCRGYRSVAPLPRAVEAELPSFILLRRLQLTAWIASHAETPTAQDLGSAYTDGTLSLAERFLSMHA